MYSDGKDVLMENGSLSIDGRNGIDLNYAMHHTLLCVVEVVFLLAIVLLAVFGNTTNIVVIGSSKSLKNVQGCFLLSLAVADLGMGLVAAMALAPGVMHRWPYGEVMCKIVAFLSEVFTRVSLLMIICLSIERYIAVVHPFHHQRYVTKKKVLVVILALWIACGAFFAFMFTSVGLGHEYDDDKLTCSAAYEDNVVYYIVALVVLLVPGFIVITFTSIRVHIRVLESSRRRAILFGRSGSSGKTKTEGYPMLFKKNMKAFKLLIIIAGVYYITWLPYTILASLILTVVCHTDIPGLVEFLAFWLTISSGGINVFVYFVMNKKFRKRAKTIWRRLRTGCRACWLSKPWEGLVTPRHRESVPTISAEQRYFIGIRNSKGEVLPTNVRMKPGSFSDDMMNDFGVIPTDQHIFSLRSLKKMRSEPMRKRSVGLPTMSLKMDSREQGEQPQFHPAHDV